MRRPARHPDNSERRPDPPVRIGEALGVDLRGSREEAPRPRSARAGDKRVRRAHGAQILDQTEQGGIADRHRLHVGDGQREACPLQQGAGVAHVGERAPPGLAPPWSSVSAASRLSLSSASVPPPGMAPRNSPSGRSARLIWISVPGKSLASCSDSSETARSMLSGSSGIGRSCRPGRRRCRATASASTRRTSGLAGCQDRVARRAVRQNSAAALSKCRSTAPAARRDRRPRDPAGTTRPERRPPTHGAWADKKLAVEDLLQASAFPRKSGLRAAKSIRCAAHYPCQIDGHYQVDGSGAKSSRACRQGVRWAGAAFCSRRPAPAAAARSRSPARCAASAGRNSGSSKGPGAR